MGGADRKALRRYAEAVQMWAQKFDTFEIAARLGLPECIVACWVANFREMSRQA
jgi:hypothetical protein